MQNPQRCANCGAPVSGRYCSACGQRADHELHSMRHILGDLVEDLTHADSRLWSTFGPLLFRPGFLTQEFLEGRRARYLPPFRLYFILSIVFFLVMSATTTLKGSPDDAVATVQKAGAQARAAIEEELRNTTDPEEQAELSEQLRQFDAGVGKLPADVAALPSCAEDAEKLARFPWLRDRIRESCEKSRADRGRELGQNFVHNIGRAMFVFLPLLAGIMKLLYWRPRRLYITHLLLLVHNHAATFLLLSVTLLATKVIPSEAVAGYIALAMVAYLAIYYYRSLRRVYGEGRLRTLAKLGTLFLGYVVCGMLMVALTVVVSAVTL